MREKTNITLHPTVKKHGIFLAKEEERSLSEYIERLLEAQWEARNIRIEGRVVRRENAPKKQNDTSEKN